MKIEEANKDVGVKQSVELFIPEEENNQDAAFRIFDKESEIFYSSTRIGGLKPVDGGYAAVIPADDFEKYAGKRYTLVTLGSKRKVLEGEIKALLKDKRTNGSK